MCGPSSGMKAINTQIQSFSKQMTSEATSIFGDASQVFNNIVSSAQNIVNGGPGQQGFSAAELSARNAAAVEAGATEARNLKAEAGSAVGAIGGGNVVMPSGSTEATLMSAEQKAAADTAAAENQVQQEDYATGNANYWKAMGAEESAPGVFATSNQANEEATGAQKTAFQSQQEIDNQSNWAMNDIMKLGSAAVGGLVSGFTGGMGASAFGALKNAGGKDSGNTASEAAAAGVNEGDGTVMG